LENLGTYLEKDHLFDLMIVSRGFELTHTFKEYLCIEIKQQSMQMKPYFKRDGLFEVTCWENLWKDEEYFEKNKSNNHYWMYLVTAFQK
jgi:hypothetical protein